VADDPFLELLRNLPRVGTLVKDRGYRQVWRFTHGGRAYFLKFYPNGGARDRWRRRFRGSPAVREFLRLQMLQKAAVPSPRATAMLRGLRLEGRVGDAVILEAIEPSVPLDVHLNDLALRGERPRDHRDLAHQLIELLLKLGRAKLGHGDLHLGNFLLHQGKLFLIDAIAVRPGGLRTSDIFQLGFSVSRFATRTDLLRGWRELAGGDKLPDRNPIAARRFRTFVQKAGGDNRYFGRLSDAGGWHGLYFRQAKYPRRWSAVSRMEFTDADWRTAWTTLRARVEADSLEVLKRTASGDVLAGELVLGERRVPVIVKHPRRKYWYRWVNEVGRGSRARRAWFKSWEMVARHVPVAWPMLLMEKRTLGYVTDALIVFERIPGRTLFHADLDAMAPRDRDTIFRRAGRTLRTLERHGFSHYDAKSTNFIVAEDDRVGPTPVMVDMDGIRRRGAAAVGIERLLRAMRRHAQYAPADSLALCQGYAPYAPLQQEEPGPEPGPGEGPATGTGKEPAE
jgi:tRNA A-37 threonylcarbamoyl transferase component Bud32